MMDPMKPMEPMQPMEPMKPMQPMSDDGVQAALAGVMLPGTQTSVASVITQSQRQNSELDLTLNLPADFSGDISSLQSAVLAAVKGAGITSVKLKRA